MGGLWNNLSGVEGKKDEGIGMLIFTKPSRPRLKDAAFNRNRSFTSISTYWRPNDLPNLSRQGDAGLDVESAFRRQSFFRLFYISVKASFVL